MDQAILAYCAGIIDADGTIGIKRNTYSMRVVGDSKQPTYSERVCVKQVEPQAVDLLHTSFGGYRFVAKPTAAQGKALQGWQVTDLKAHAFLVAVRPFLRIKHRQADNCINLRIIKNASKKERVAAGRGCAGSKARAPEHGAEMQRLCDLAHALNHVGV